MSASPPVLGGYRIVANLGAGGMAKVYLALSQRPGFEKLFVLKVLRSEYADDEEFLNMFTTEAHIASRLNHPNVVHTYEVGAEDGHHFIAMEYLEGQSLARVRKRSIPLELHLRVLGDVLNGLHYAHQLIDYDGHSMNIVHRDVSPQNVLVTYPGQSKILDFGIAKVAGSAAFTREGTLKGKAAYMAPEQAMGKPVDHRADIFAVGVMLWEALANRRLCLPAAEEVAIYRRRITGNEEKVLDANPDAPREVVAIVEKAMAFDPAARFETAEAMASELEAYLRKSEGSDAAGVARFMNDKFAEDRSKIRRIIEMGAKSSPSLESITLSTSTTSKVAAKGDASSPSTPSSERVAAKTGVSTSRRSFVAGIAGVSLVVAGLAIAAGSRSFAPARVDPTTSTAIPATPPASTAPAPSVSQQPATASSVAAESSVHVTVDVTPITARLMLDGQAVSTSFACVAGGPHQLEVSAPGYAVYSQKLSPERDIRLSVRLVPLRGAPPPTPSPPTPSASASPPHTASVKPASPEDVDLSRPDHRPKRTIDDSNPY